MFGNRRQINVKNINNFDAKGDIEVISEQVTFPESVANIKAIVCTKRK